MSRKKVSAGFNLINHLNRLSHIQKQKKKKRLNSSSEESSIEKSSSSESPKNNRNCQGKNKKQQTDSDFILSSSSSSSQSLSKQKQKQQQNREKNISNQFIQKKQVQIQIKKSLDMPCKQVISKKEQDQQDSKNFQKQKKHQSINDLLKNMVHKIQKDPQKKIQVSESQQNKSNCDQQQKKVSQKYKPKKGSQPYVILKALFMLEGHQKPVSFDELQQKFQQIKKTPFRLWRAHRKRLQKTGFIIVQDKSEDKIRLLPKGVRYIGNKIGQKQKIRRSRYLKPQNIQSQQSPKINQENQKQVQKQSHQQRQQQKQESKNSQKDSKQKSKNKYFRQKQIQNKNQRIIQNKYPKQILCSSKGADRLKMIVNPMTFLSREQLDQFNQRVAQQGIKFIIPQVFSSINFLWETQGKIVDCFGIFIDGIKTDLQQTKIAISQALYCSSDFFFILVEFNSNQLKRQSQITEKPKSLRRQKEQRRIRRKFQTLEKFVFKARAAGIQVVRTQNRDQSMKYLRKITSLLSKKIRNIPETGQSINIYGSVDKLNLWFKQHRNYNLRRITVKCLNQIKCLSNNSKRRIAQKLPTFVILYTKLKKLDSFEERLRFMQWLLQQHHSNPQANRIIVSLLFLNDYKLYKRIETVQEVQQNSNSNQEQSNQDNKSVSQKNKQRQEEQQNQTKNINKQLKNQKKENKMYKQDKKEIKKQKKEQKDNQLKRQNEDEPKKSSKEVKNSGLKKYNLREQAKAGAKEYEYESDDDYITKN